MERESGAAELAGYTGSYSSGISRPETLEAEPPMRIFVSVPLVNSSSVDDCLWFVTNCMPHVMS